MSAFVLNLWLGGFVPVFLLASLRLIQGERFAAADGELLIPARVFKGLLVLWVRQDAGRRDVVVSALVAAAVFAWGWPVNILTDAGSVHISQGGRRDAGRRVRAVRTEVPNGK